MHFFKVLFFLISLHDNNIDELLGLCYIKVPTVAPFALSFYFNRHSLLETKLNKAHISFTKKGNAFLSVSDFEKAQHLSDNIRVKDIHTALDIFAKRYCPLPEECGSRYQWSLSEAEYSYDIIFRNEETLLLRKWHRLKRIFIVFLTNSII